MPFLVDDVVGVALVVDRDALDAADVAEVVDHLAPDDPAAGRQLEPYVLRRREGSFRVVGEHRGGLAGGVEIADHRVEPVVAVRVETAQPRRSLGLFQFRVNMSAGIEIGI